MVINTILLDMPALDVFYSFLTGIVLFTALTVHEANVVYTFKSYMKFQETVTAKVNSENQEYLMKMQKEEMRHMIGECVSSGFLCSPHLTLS